MTSKPAAKLTSLLTIKDVAEHLKVSARTVRRAIKDRELHAHQIRGQLRISQDDLAAFLGMRRN